ncbi:uncharacterized protein TRIADDRAFT_60487 [Trichoplax adhaerens]|uniref:OCEL domain-containing protein n=1 Tax=Trichoplax adhaerens TaxID=10228 RepID=B3S8C4_TRIAD|nr:hypothetical protein TRIADDRAFT_60487 [Trichoplax adhaerens]EDV21077.1 hypothetical protein TRIADDRAFT_60487 [Trichoplax adhaerens]|eukprot:XP_002116407.1 hypothetical protein TRIADDRAFT_60487 [Trichoplax adhaerens]
MSSIQSGNYTLSRNRSTDDSIVAVQVKLTDSCLNALDSYIKFALKLNEDHPTLSCDGKTGRIFIPDKNGGRDFQFSCTTLPEDRGPFECYSMHQSHSDKMIYEGSITTRMSIQATDEIYAKTKIKMEKAEEERKESRAKLVNPVSKATKGGRNKSKPVLLRPTRTIPASKPLLPSRSTNYVTTSSNKPYKDRVIHYLAIQPLNKLELLTRLHKDGRANKKDTNRLGSILKEVAVMKNNKFYLHKHLYSEVQVDKFSSYTENDKRLVALNISKYCSNALRDNVNISQSSSNARRTDAKQEKHKPSPKKSVSTNPPSGSDKKWPHGDAQPATSIKKTKRNIHETEFEKTVKQPEKRSKLENLNSIISAVNDKAGEIDYLAMYPTITAMAERDRYKRIFNKDYTEYTKLKERKLPMKF